MMAYLKDTRYLRETYHVERLSTAAIFVCPRRMGKTTTLNWHHTCLSCSQPEGSTASCMTSWTYSLS
jgi:hypothetical protein